MRGTKGLLARAIGSISGVFGVTVEEKWKLVRRPPAEPMSFSDFEKLEDKAMRDLVWAETIDRVPFIEVDLDLLSPFEKMHFRATKGMSCLDHLGVIFQVEEVLEELRPAGVQWVIKQKEELMGKDGELPTFSDLAKKVPDIKNTVMDLMGYLDHWTLRSMQVKTDKKGNFESAWVPGLAPEAAKPKNMESWTVLLLEFCIPSRSAERFTTLVRSAATMTSKLGKAGSFTNTLEETVRKTLVENENLRWAAAAYKEIAERAVTEFRDVLASEEVSNKLFHTRKATALLNELGNQDTQNVGAVFLQRYNAMEKALNERRPELAAELIRGLDDE